jgi:hypothetical protein
MWKSRSKDHIGRLFGSRRPTILDVDSNISGLYLGDWGVGTTRGTGDDSTHIGVHWLQPLRLIFMAELGTGDCGQWEQLERVSIV